MIATQPIGKDFWAPDSEPPPLGVGPNMVQFPHSLLGWKQFHNVEETILDIATVSLFVRLGYLGSSEYKNNSERSRLV